MAELLTQLLPELSASNVVSTIQIVVMVFMLRILLSIQKQVQETRDWHDVDDPQRPGAKLWWGLDAGSAVDELKALNQSVSKLVHTAERREAEDRMHPDHGRG